MKILLLTLEYPPQKGGVASYYGGMVEELKRRGQEVDVISNDGAHWYNPSQPPGPTLARPVFDPLILGGGD